MLVAAVRKIRMTIQNTISPTTRGGGVAHAADRGVNAHAEPRDGPVGDAREADGQRAQQSRDQPSDKENDNRGQKLGQDAEDAVQDPREFRNNRTCLP